MYLNSAVQTLLILKVNRMSWKIFSLGFVPALEFTSLEEKLERCLAALQRSWMTWLISKALLVSNYKSLTLVSLFSLFPITVAFLTTLIMGNNFLS